MEDSGRVEAYGRRDFLKYAALCGASVVAGSAVAAFAQDAEKLARERERLFGRAPWHSRFFGKEPILADGELEQLSYDLYLKDQSQFRAVVIDAIQFLRGQHQETYKEVFGSEWQQHWRKDRKKVVVGLLRAINVPMYDVHRDIRNELKNDGILDFQWQQRNLEKGLDELVKVEQKYVKNETARQVFRSQLVGRVANAAEGLKLFYLVTLPVYDPKGHPDFEKQAADIAETARDALDNAQNLADGLKANDPVETGHQTWALVRKLDTLFTDLGGLADRSLAYRTDIAQKQYGSEPMKKISVSRNGRAELVWTYDYLYEEWETELKFESWVQEIKRKVKNLPAPAKK